MMNIPESDRVCVNCRFLLDQTGDEETCNGRECCNWDGKYTENFFEPDEDYISDYVANCDNCEHQHRYSICEQCRRFYRDDKWEARK